MAHPDLLDGLDSELSSILLKIRTEQEKYRAVHGRYLQTLWSHATIPADGGTRRRRDSYAPSDRVTVVRTVQATKDDPGTVTVTPHALAGLPSQPSLAWKIDEWLDPDGRCGYMVTFAHDVAGTRWVREVRVIDGLVFDEEWTKDEG